MARQCAVVPYTCFEIPLSVSPCATTCSPRLGAARSADGAAAARSRAALAGTPCTFSGSTGMRSSIPAFSFTGSTFGFAREITVHLPPSPYTAFAMLCIVCPACTVRIVNAGGITPAARAAGSGAGATTGAACLGSCFTAGGSACATGACESAAILGGACCAATDTAARSCLGAPGSAANRIAGSAARVGHSQNVTTHSPARAIAPNTSLDCSDRTRSLPFIQRCP